MKSYTEYLYLRMLSLRCLVYYKIARTLYKIAVFFTVASDNWTYITEKCVAELRGELDELD